MFFATMVMRIFCVCVLAGSIVLAVTAVRHHRRERRNAKAHVRALGGGWVSTDQLRGIRDVAQGRYDDKL